MGSRSLASRPIALLLGFLVAASADAQMPVRDTPQLAATIKATMLSIINEQRHAFGLSTVRLDPLASSVADALCRRQVYDRSVGHISTDGLSPYHRYSFAGGLDGLTENTAAWSKDAPYTEEEIVGLVEESMRAMLAEAPPDDGHRRAILDPRATHVGLGFAWRGGEVRVAHEFLRRYLRWSEPPPREIRIGEKVVCAARPATGWEIAAISVHFEPAPKPLSRARASGIESYELPETRADFQPRRPGKESDLVRIARGGAAHRELTVAPDGSFTFTIPFEHGPGLYTLVAWVGNGDTRVAASNISIRVNP